MINNIIRQLVLHQYLTCYPRPHGIITIMKLMICYIMQDGSKLHNKHVSFLFTCQMLSHLPDTVNMPPVMPGAFTFKTLFYFFCDSCNDHITIHSKIPVIVDKTSCLSIITL